jgi:large subunit ribosomal protein L19
MDQKTQEIVKNYLRTDLPDFRPGDTVRVYFKIRDIVIDEKKKTKEVKERIQPFEGVVIARKHGKGITATFTVRRIVDNVGVEKTFPLHSPLIEKIEVLKRGKVRRAKLYYLREAKGKRGKIKAREDGKNNKIDLESESPLETNSQNIKNEEREGE